jgi:hypothetical protein
MSSPRQDDPRRREEALARALAEALRPARPSVNDASGAADCPDAEVIAAYADRGLAEEEIARWEQHFAECARCQKVLAVLSVTAEPLAQAEVEHLGELAASVPVPLAATAAPSPLSRPEVATRRHGASAPAWRVTPWRFLAPAAGVAAALALWFALRPTAPVVNNSAELNQAKTAAQPAAPPAASDTEQMAEANVPPPPSEAPAASAPREMQSSTPSGGASTDKKDATRSDELDRSSTPPAPSAQGIRELPLNGRDWASLQTLQGSSAGSADESSKEQSAAPGAAGGAGRSEEASNEQSGSSGAAPTPPQAAARPAPAPVRDMEQATVQAPPAQAPPALGGAFGASNLRALNKSAGGAAPAAQAWLDTFEMLDGSVSWRVGTGGRIERSTDQGQTWQAQTSGVTTDLSEGDAVSAQVAWAVGRAGVILRTTDGEHWRRTALPASLPAGAPPDWMLVQARDALRATIVSTGGSAFSTQDGGATWVASGPPMQ